VGVPSRACVQCGQALEPDARFCNSCGQAIPSPGSYAPTGTMVAPGRGDPGRPVPPPAEPAWPNKDSYQPTQYAPVHNNSWQSAGQYPPAPAGYHSAPPPARHQGPPPNRQAQPEHYPPSPSEFQPLPGELPPVGGDYPSPPGGVDFSSWFQDGPPRPRSLDGPRADYPEPYPEPGYYGPPGGPPPGPNRQRGSRRALPLVLTVVVAAVLAAGVAFFLLRHSGSSGSTASDSQSASASASASFSGQAGEQQAATRLAGLLSQSGHDKSSITTAYDDVNACGPQLSQDAQTFSSAASSRQQLLTQLSTMPGRSALPAGMLQTLTTAWQASITADQDYSQWAQDEAGGCKKNDHANAHFVAANAPDNKATADKVVFLRQWNPIATRYGLPNYQWYQI